MASPLGRQWIVDLYDCDPATLKRAYFVEEIMVSAAHRIKATVVSTAFHEFSPFGVSGMVVIAESHLAIHTWPEYGYAAVDVFTCGDSLHPEAAAEYIAGEFRAKKKELIEFTRGHIGGPAKLFPESLGLKISELNKMAGLRPALASIGGDK